MRDGGPLGLRHSTDSQRMKEVMDFGVVQKLPKELARELPGAEDGGADRARDAAAGDAEGVV